MNVEQENIRLNPMGDPIPTLEQRKAEYEEVASEHKIFIEFVGTDGTTFVATPMYNNEPVLVGVS